MIQALQKNNWRDSQEWLTQVKHNLINREHRTKLCWIPSHCGTIGNERADELADEGAKLDQKQAPVSCGIMKAKIRGEKWEIKHERAKETFGVRRSPKWKVERMWPAEVRRLYRRLRSGHAKELKAYRKFIQTEEDAACDLGGEEDETIKHVLCDCPAHEASRRREFESRVEVKMLVEDPDKCRKILAQRYKRLAISNQAQEETNRIDNSGGQRDPPGDTGLVSLE